MRMEYVPVACQPDLRFEFGIDEILAYLEAHLANLEAAPENHSPHKQIVRDHQERMQPISDLQAKIRSMVAHGLAASLTWDDFMHKNPAYCVANLLEYECGTASCPACQDVYSCAKLIMYEWSWAEYGGRLFTCPNAHELMRSNERIGELTIPPQPFKRTLRPRPAIIRCHK